MRQQTRTRHSALVRHRLGSRAPAGDSGSIGALAWATCSAEQIGNAHQVTDFDTPVPDATPAPTADAARRPLRILIGADTFAPNINGAARFAERLAAGLVARGHEVHASVPGIKYKRVPAAIEVVEGQPVMMHRLPSVRWAPHDWLRFVWPWRAKHYARKVLDLVNPDVVHIQSHIVIGRGLTREARKRGIPVVATNHVMAENILDFTTLPPVLDKIFFKFAWEDAKRTFNMARAVTTPTRKAADFLEATTQLTGVIPISCGIDASHYSPDLTPRDANRILIVGRLTTEKQVDVTLRAVAQLDPELRATVDIVGGGDQRHKLEELAHTLGISDAVTFHGHATDEELRALYSRASVYVIASIAELQSISTMEALASALPVVGADAMALPHLIHDQENGYLFPAGDVDAAADRITKVLTATPEERLRLQREALNVVKVHDINRTLDTFEALYRGEPIPD